MKLNLSHATASVSFVASFAAVAAPSPDAGVGDIDRAIANAPKEAISGFYQGSPSTDFSHLLPSPTNQRRPPLPSPDHISFGDTARNISESPKFSSFYRYELSKLAQICTPLDATDHRKFDTLDWFQKYVATPDLPTFRRDFIEALYFTIGRQPDSEQKYEAIARLNFVLPDSPAVLDYLGKKRNEVEERLKTDSFLLHIKARENWPTLSRDNRETILNYVTRVTLNTLLPNKNIAYPRAFLIQNILDEPDAMYSSNFNETYINDDSPDITEDYDKAIQAILHENAHAFQSIIAGWYNSGALPDHSPLKRQGKLFFINMLKGGTGIAHGENYLGYRLGINERSAWAFQLAASDTKSPDFATDTFMNLGKTQHVKYADPPVYRSSTEGRLPAACLE